MKIPSFFITMVYSDNHLESVRDDVDPLFRI